MDEVVEHVRQRLFAVELFAQLLNITLDGVHVAGRGGEAGVERDCERSMPNG